MNSFRCQQRPVIIFNYFAIKFPRALMPSLQTTNPPILPIHFAFPTHVTSCDERCRTDDSVQCSFCSHGHKRHKTNCSLGFINCMVHILNGVEYRNVYSSTYESNCIEQTSCRYNCFTYWSHIRRMELEFRDCILKDNLLLFSRVAE